MHRRQLIAGMVSTLLAPGVLADEIASIEALRPGDFTWHPERQSSGPVAVIVSIPQQLVHVYRNGIRIGVSTCSTGKKGHRTPTGVFVILQKDKHHRSSTYNNAPMPNMNRLTWSGIALHAGQLPGYPASHGCVRLPMEFSEDLFGITHLGTPVIIAGDEGDPWELTHPGLVLGAYADASLVAAVREQSGKNRPDDWRAIENAPLVSVVASSADRKIKLLVNEGIYAEGNLQIDGSAPLGDRVLVLHSGDNGTYEWAYVASTGRSGDGFSATGLMNRLSSERAFATVMASYLRPGAVAVLTDLPLTPQAGSGSDFVILNGRSG